MLPRGPGEFTTSPSTSHVLAKGMSSFQPGLFAGGDEMDQIRDNLDLERWFRLLKGHERRIHGHKHAGVRIVQEGSTVAWPWTHTRPIVDCSPLTTSYRPIARSLRG